MLRDNMYALIVIDKGFSNKGMMEIDEVVLHTISRLRICFLDLY